ncbi:MAG: hypothetical protein Q4G43_12720 [Mobilicoccus sp.]|nr:hypothetical protein [Mobilicoccus sp.]
MTRVVQAVARLRSVVDDGTLADLCRRHRIDLLVLHGSARRDPSTAGDVDLAYLPEHGTAPDHLDVVNDLIELIGEEVDVMPLHRAEPVAAHAALGEGEPLVELTPHRYALAQMRAFGEYRDTQGLRDLPLSLLGRR